MATQHSGSTYPNSDPMDEGDKRSSNLSHISAGGRGILGRQRTKINVQKTRATGELVYEPISETRHSVTPHSVNKKMSIDMKKIGPDVDTTMFDGEEQADEDVSIAEEEAEFIAFQDGQQDDLDTQEEEEEGWIEPQVITPRNDFLKVSEVLKRKNAKITKSLAVLPLGPIAETLAPSIKMYEYNV